MKRIHNLKKEGLGLLPQNSWITKYIDYTSNQESPTRFHIWAAIGCIAAALGRKVSLYRGYYQLYTNQYIIIVAESARCRKSTSTDIAIDDLLETTGLCNIVRQKMTAEKLCVELSRTDVINNEIVLYAPELATFLGASAFQSGLIPLITGLYNCPAKTSYKTKESGEFEMNRVCINMMGATTLDWMSSNMPGDTIEGGFTGRVIFVVAEDRRHKEAWPSIDSEQVETRQSLLVDLTRIAKLRGNFEVTKAAMECYKDWYDNTPEVEDIRLRGYDGRKGDHVLKIAMILNASEDHILVEPHLKIERRHIEMSLGLLESTEKLMSLAYRGAAYSKTSKDNDRVLRQLETMGGIVTHSALLKKNYNYLNAAEFRIVMDTLMESGQVNLEIARTGKKTYKLVKGK